MTDESNRLLEVAQELVEDCPAELGSEIAVTGSVGAGLADEYSDIELLFLSETVPNTERVREWLEGVDGTQEVRVGRENGGVWAWCRLDGVEIDPYWGTLAEAVAEVEAITSGTVVEHRRLAFAHVLRHSIALRTSGVLEELARSCRDYPEGLGSRLIVDALSGWELPAVRIGAIARSDVLEARSWLQHDAERVLRIVFTLNEQWEPPRWKWLRVYAAELTIAPPKLVERLERVLLMEDLVAASRTLNALALEVLALLPDDVDRERAERGLEVRIAALEGKSAALERMG